MDRALSIAGSSCDKACDFGYEFDLDHAIDIIRKSRALRVGLQAPEGLKRAAVAIARNIKERTGAEVIISGDPCYGACDVDLKLCEEVDLMLHLGHAELEDGPDKVIFLEARMREDPKTAVEKAVLLLTARRVGIATTVQHVHSLELVLDILKKHGVEGVIGHAGGRVKYAGQVLGCSYSSVKVLDVDEYLFIGTGQFHPLGIALATGKRVIIADPVTCKASEIDTDPMLRRRFGVISRAMRAKRFAILISKKPGQKRMDLAERMKTIGQAKGLEMFLVYLDNIEPDRLLNLGAEAAVSTACPRVALDDAAKYSIPILTPSEFEVMLGERPWEKYAFDEID